MGLCASKVRSVNARARACSTSKYASPCTQPTVHGDAGAHAYVTIGPKVGKASAMPQLSHLRGIADANPTPSTTTALPTTDDADKNWSNVDNKQAYLDAAADLVEAYFDEKLPAPAPAVSAQVTAVIKVYRLVLDDEQAAEDVDEIYTSIKATLINVLEAERKNPWGLRVLQGLHTALGAGAWSLPASNTCLYCIIILHRPVLRPLTPSITEPLDELHTARPTPESKAKTSKVVAKRLALAVANLASGPVVRIRCMLLYLSHHVVSCIITHNVAGSTFGVLFIVVVILLLLLSIPWSFSTHHDRTCKTSAA